MTYTVSGGALNSTQTKPNSVVKDCFALYNSTCLLLRHAVYVDYLYLYTVSQKKQDT